MTVTTEHRLKVGRLSVTMKLRDQEIAGMTFSRSGDQRDDGAGFITIDAEETRGLFRIMQGWYEL